MSRLILISISILFFNNILLSANLDDCSWDNKNKVPCLEITSYISNSSEHSKSGVNKIVMEA